MGIKKNSTFHRRHFFRMAANECFSVLGEFRGTPQFKLVDLWELDRPTLGKIIPKVLESAEIHIRDSIVFAKIPSGGEEEFLSLFELASEKAFLFNLINGNNTIDRIVEEVCGHCNITTEESFIRVRAFFLELVQKGVCIPANGVGKRLWGEITGV